MRINKKLIKELVRKKSFKQKEIAVKIGVNPQDWNNWMFRGIFPHYNKLEILADILDINVNSLLEPDVSEPTSNYIAPVAIKPEEFIPFYDIEAQTDISHFWTDESSLAPKDYVYLPGLKANFVFPFYGKGMEPNLSNGNWLALRRINDLSFFNYGNLHLIVTKEQLIVRFIKKSEMEGHIILSTQNNSDDEISLPKKSVKALFMVVTIIKREVI